MMKWPITLCPWPPEPHLLKTLILTLPASMMLTTMRPLMMPLC